MFSYNLYGDIGGTNARFQVCDSKNNIVIEEKMLAENFDNFADALSVFITTAQLVFDGTLDAAAFGIAAAVISNDEFQLTNNTWRFSRKELMSQFGFKHLVVVNDFVANAYAVPTLKPRELDPIIFHKKRAGFSSLIVGPGTGLGMTVIPPQGNPLPAEVGATSFLAACEFENDIIDLMNERDIPVIRDNILSGRGLSLIHEVLHRAERTLWPASTPDEISQQAYEEKINNAHGSATETFKVYSDMLGSFLSEMAKITLPYGGIYLTGGVVHKNHNIMDWDIIRRHFQENALLNTVPIMRIIPEFPAFRGLQIALAASVK